MSKITVYGMNENLEIERVVIEFDEFDKKLLRMKEAANLFEDIKMIVNNRIVVYDLKEKYGEMDESIRRTFLNNAVSLEYFNNEYALPDRCIHDTFIRMSEFD